MASQGSSNSKMIVSMYSFFFQSHLPAVSVAPMEFIKVSSGTPVSKITPPSNLPVLPAKALYTRQNNGLRSNPGSLRCLFVSRVSMLTWHAIWHSNQVWLSKIPPEQIHTLSKIPPKWANSHRSRAICLLPGVILPGVIFFTSRRSAAGKKQTNYRVISPIW